MLGIRRHIDSQLLDQPFRNRAVRLRALDGIGSAKAEDRPATGFEFVTLGVAAEIVVVLKNQNARFLRPPFSGKSAPLPAR